MVEFIQKYWIVIISIVIITCFFIFFICELCILYKAYKAIRNILDKEDKLNELKDDKFKILYAAYIKTFTFTVNGNKKTNIPASEIFNYESISACFKFNPQMLSMSSGTLVGLGLLGTFFGLTVGIAGFDSDSSDKIQKSIQGLLNGMATAFVTSLLGMGYSIIFSLLEKNLRKKFDRSLNFLTDALDDLYYIDDISIVNNKIDNLIAFNDKLVSDSVALINNKIDYLIASNEQLLKLEFDSVNNKIENQMTFTDDNGNKVRIANSIREIQEHNSRQTAALRSFSSDLAMGLNDLIGTTIDEKIIQKIVPLMDNIDKTTNEVVQHIDTLASNMASPATDMIETIVNELGKSMSKMMDEFKTNLSGTATNQLEQLTANLGDATKAMADFPRNMETISNTLLVTIDEVKSAVAEITNTSASSNSTAMKQMQEQITFATTSISNAITKVDEVMTSLTKSSEKSTNETVNKLTHIAAHNHASV